MRRLVSHNQGNPAGRFLSGPRLGTRPNAAYAATSAIGLGTSLDVGSVAISTFVCFSCISGQSLLTIFLGSGGHTCKEEVLMLETAMLFAANLASNVAWAQLWTRYALPGAACVCCLRTTPACARKAVVLYHMFRRPYDPCCSTLLFPPSSLKLACPQILSSIREALHTRTRRQA